jgi:transposase-like protein
MRKEELLKADFLKQFKTADELNNFLKELQKRAVEQMLEGEMDEHIGYEKYQKTKIANSRNGHSKKKLKTSFGETEINVPRDRDSTFSPVLVPKRHNMVDGLESVIISLYSKGMSVRDIEDQIRSIYGFEISASTISRITDRVAADIYTWQSRPLESVYAIVWMDGIVFKVRGENGKVVNKTMYIAVGLRTDGLKEVLGLWLGKNESASFWMTVLTDIKARGVEDILITSTDNLNGFTEAIKAVFPNSTTQICIVHQIRNACKFVSWKDRKALTKDLREIYGSTNKDLAEKALEVFASKWNSKYPHAVRGWYANWDELSAFFSFPLEIRKIIYTTNTIENLNGKIRKYTKTKLSFSTDEAVMKSTFLAVSEATRKWSMPIRDWGLIFEQFLIIFGNRIKF